MATATLTGIIYLVVGLLACFFGKRLFRIVLALLGFVLGFQIGSQILVGQPETTVLIVSLIVGVILAALFWTYYKFAHLLFGAFLGWILAGLLAPLLGISNATTLLIVQIVGAVIGAFVGLALADLMIRVSTAFGGATTAVTGLAILAVVLNVDLPITDPATASVTGGQNSIVTIIVVFVLGVLGFIHQTRNLRRR